MPNCAQNLSGPTAPTDDAPPSYALRCRRIYDELIKDLRFCPKRKQDRKNLEGFT